MHANGVCTAFMFPSACLKVAQVFTSDTWGKIVQGLYSFCGNRNLILKSGQPCEQLSCNGALTKCVPNTGLREMKV